MGIGAGADALPAPRAPSRDGVLLERGQELATIGESLAAACTGAGRVLLLSGPAGIGKTSLLDAGARMARERGMTVLRVRGDELVMESSFAAVRELLWEEVRKAGPVIWDGAAHLAAPVFEPDQPTSSERDVAVSVLHGLYWLVCGLAERAPLALFVDDAQWLDVASARFTLYLARRAEAVPVLLAVAVRGVAAPGSTPMLASLVESAAAELRLGPLSSEASATLVRGHLGPRADEELCRSCHRATGGNPFYLGELIAALEAEPRRPTVRLAQRVRELGTGTVGRTVLVRLARLGPDAEALAQGVAVLGPGSALRHAAALAGLERHRAESAADALRAADLLSADRALSFAHPIVSEALIAEQARSRLASLHGQAASLLAADGASADRVCAHLLATEPFGEEWVVDALRSAAHQAVARGAPEVAVTYLRRALAEPPPPGTRLNVLVELGRAERLTPTPSDFEALREALALSRDPQLRAELALELALALFAVIATSDARAVLEEALDRADGASAEMVDLLEAALIGGTLDELSQTPALLARAGPHIDAVRRGAARDPRMLACLSVLGAVTGMEAREAAALAELALGDERLLANWLDDGYVTATWALCATDRLSQADAAADAGIAEAQRRGLAPMFMQLSVIRAEIAFRMGDLDLAEALAERALDLGRELGVEHVALVLWLPVIAMERGDVRAAARLADDIVLDPAVLEGSFGVSALAHRGRVRVAAGRLEEGIADLLEADARMVAAGWQTSVNVDWIWSASVALERLGRHDHAVRLADRELGEAMSFGAPRRHAIALSLSGLLDSGHRGLERLERSVEILERTPAKLEYARALVNLGEGLRGRGERTGAREALTRGLDLAHRCGAGALVERAHAELVASGARPRRPAMSGPEALTPAEARTARMAAGGLSNREIAQSLFVSAKTVEAQLSRAYAKLSIRGRNELAAALSASPPEPNTANR